MGEAAVRIPKVRRQRDATRAQSRSAILDAARRVAARDGARDLSLRGVAAEAGFATMRGGFDADGVAYGGGRSVILRRTKGASVRQSPNAAFPTNRSPSESETG